MPLKHLHIKYWALLVFAPLVTFGPLALINQAFWDDWVLIAYADAGTLWEFFKQMGRREQYWLVQPFAGPGDARACIVTVLLLFCAMAPLLYTIIRKTTQWPATDAFWAALLTALVPLNQARFILSTIPYAFSSLFFALALAILLRDLELPSVGRRILIAVLLVMGFSTNSFLVLAWIPLAIVATDAWRKTNGISSEQRAKAAIRAVINRGELVLLPLIYWPAKKILEPTYGLYANYNTFHMGISAALRQTVITFIDQFRGADVLIPARSDLPELSIAAAVIIVLFIAAAWTWNLPIRTREEDAGKSRWITDGLTFVVALALIVSALFPYVIVGQAPRFSGLWETRHQTTLMMVSGFAIIALLRLFLPRSLLWKSAAIIAAVFLVIDMSVTHELLADALETRALANLFKQHASAPGTMMLVVENDRDYRALGRFLSYYELSFLINAGHTDGARMAISNREVVDPSTGDYVTSPVPAVIAALTGLCELHRSHPQYGFGGFVSNGKIETVKLAANREPPRFFEAIAQTIRESAAAEPTEEPKELVRIESNTTPIGGACVAPCCSDD